LVGAVSKVSVELWGRPPQPSDSPGSAGERGAQEYMVKRLEALGIPSAGSSGYYQPVELRSRGIVETDSSLVLLRDGQEQRVTLGQEAFFSTRLDLAPRAAAQPLHTQ
jgi:hypothetical protein